MDAVDWILFPMSTPQSSFSLFEALRLLLALEPFDRTPSLSTACATPSAFDVFSAGDDTRGSTTVGCETTAGTNGAAIIPFLRNISPIHRGHVATSSAVGSVIQSAQRAASINGLN